MKDIISGYRRLYRVTLISNWAVVVLTIMGFALTGTFEKKPFTAIMISAAFVLLVLFYTVEFIIQPLKFSRKAKVSGKSEAFNNEKPAILGKRFVFDKCIVFFNNWIIQAVDFSEITAAQLKKRKIVLTLNSGKTLAMPYYPDENPAVICAVLRSKNEKIDIVINGKHISQDEK